MGEDLGILYALWVYRFRYVIGESVQTSHYNFKGCRLQSSSSDSGIYVCR